MAIALVFVFLVFASMLGMFYSGIRYGKHSLNFQSSLLIFVYIVGCYFVAFLLICIDPYWTDNDAVEFIPFEDRWKWAILFFYFVGVLLSPLLFWSYKKLNSRNSKKREGITD
jgi:uncharacterized Tic20 family protein